MWREWKRLYNWEITTVTSERKSVPSEYKSEQLNKSPTFGVWKITMSNICHNTQS
jgi:hypothetical protein